MSNTKFPLPLEIIRSISQLLDTASFGNKKRLDDRIKYKDLIRKNYEESLNEFIKYPLEKVLDKELVKIIYKEINFAIDFYIQNIVKTEKVNILPTDKDYVDRSSINKFLCKYLASIFTFNFIKKLPHKYKFNDIETLFKTDKNSVSLVMEELEKNLAWKAYTRTLSKEENDKFRRWKNSDYLPSFQAIKLLCSESSLPKNLIYKIKFWLITARALDEIRNSNYKFDFFHQQYEDIYNLIKNIRQSSIQEVENKYVHIYDMLSDMLYTNQKNQEDKEILEHIFSYTDNLFKNKNCYIYNLFKADFLLFSGKLKEAMPYYEKSFQDALFKAGTDLKVILKKSLVATSFLEKTEGISNRKFLAHLKHSMILFKFELPSKNGEIQKINHKDLVEDWEVDIWARYFKNYFPEEDLFPDVNYQYLGPRELDMCLDQLHKPNYKKPNKIISYDVNNIIKRGPQLVYYTMLKDVESVRKLLLCGADVNKLSDCNESAISIALGNLVLENCGTPNIELFNTISQYEHTPETINKKWTKTRNFPLLFAVKSGSPDVVKKIIEMGATIDEWHDIEKTSPLLEALKQIQYLRDYQRMMKVYQENSKLPEHWDNVNEYLRRNYPANHTFYSQNIQYNNFNDPLSHTIRQALSENFDLLILENFKKYTSLEKLYAILDILLENGANPNFKYDIHGISGYTPLMCAVELNDNRSVQMLLKKGGDPSQPCFSNGKPYYCKDIKDYWESFDVQI